MLMAMARGYAKNPRYKTGNFIPIFIPFSGKNMPKYAYIMPANENTKGVKTLIKQGKTI